MYETKIKKWFVVALVVILLLQLAMIVFFGQKKAAYFIDEMFTFELTNYPNGGYVAKDATATWKSGQFFREAMVGSPETRFTFSIPYQNQESDVHPPLYYFFIHLMSSLFPNMDIKWIGLIPNIFFSMVTTVFLFLLSQKILKKYGIALIIAATWALSIGGITTAVFIRMYALLTMLCVLFVYCHSAILENLFENHYSAKKYVMLYFVTLSGILTQYYFLIYAFFFCGLFCLLLLGLKKWKSVVTYVVAELGAVVTAILLFPRMLYHILFGYRGTEAFSNFTASSNYLENLKYVLSILSNNCFNGWAKQLIFIVFIACFVFMLNKYFFHIKVEAIAGKLRVSANIYSTFNINWGNICCDVPSNVLLYLVMVVSVVLYLLLVCKIAPYYPDRYFMNVYPLSILGVLGFINWMLTHFLKKDAVRLTIIAICMLSITGVSYKMQAVGYLYEWFREGDQVLSEYRQYPVITISDAEWDWYADLYMYVYQYSEAVFRCRVSELSDISIAVNTRDETDDFMLYACGGYYYNMSEEELFSHINDYVNISDHHVVAYLDGCVVYYCTLKND